MVSCRCVGRTVFACALVLAGFNSTCRADENVGTGSVVITVRGPQGRPLPGQVVHLFPADPGFPEDPIPAVTTDAQGKVTVSLAAGLRRLHVTVPGVGFGSTGTFVVRPSQTTTEILPPLAGFARVCGTVPTALRAPGETVRVSNPFLDRALDFPPAAVDAQGRFEIDDVYPGHVQLTLVAGPTHSLYQQITLVPGEARTVDFQPPWPVSVSVAGVEPNRTVAIRGSVTDTAGAPVSGALVYALVPPPQTPANICRGRWGTSPEPLSAVAGGDGRYVIPGVVLGSRAEIIPLWAERPGYPQAILSVRVRAGQHEDLGGDLVLPTRHTMLTVRVIQGGVPLAGARVSVGPETFGPGVFDTGLWSLNGGVDARWGTVYQGLAATTGADGVARFVDLLPGLWNVHAEVGTYPKVLQADGGPVGIQADRSASSTLKIPPPLKDDLIVCAFGPDGGLLHGQNGNFGSVMPVGPVGGGEALTCQTDVRYHAILKQPGLYQVAVHTRDFVMPNMGWYGQMEGPYLDAFGLVAVSDGLPPLVPLRLQAVRHTPATLRVRLQDASGKPARGTVTVGGIFDSPDYAATTDADGRADFPAMPSGPYTLNGYLAGQPSPVSLWERMPPQAALTGQTRIEPQKVAVGSDESLVVILRPQPVGYIRLHLLQTPPETKELMLSDSSRPDAVEAFPGQRVDDRTGDFFYGPTPVGKDTLYVLRFGANGVSATVGTASLTVREDSVASVSLIPLPVGPATSNDPAEADAVLGTVLLNDGVTPAWNAHAVLCLPSSGLQKPQLTPQQPADARGRLLGSTTYFAQEFYRPPVVVNGRVLLPTPPTGNEPSGPVVVAWMPGLTGAAIVPYVRGQAVHIVLPPALDATGRVTVAGESVAALNGTFRVRAAYQGRGSLNDLLTLDATAQPDGSFTLPGLTPGVYRVQAARDGIWLSETQTLTVGLAPPPPLTLDIPQPGVPLDLHLTDGRGHALAGRAVAIGPPDGPLSDLCWPPVVTADGKGDLHLDGLGAGRHFLHDPWSASPDESFNVPPVSGTADRVPAYRRIVLPQAWDAPETHP